MGPVDSFCAFHFSMVSLHDGSFPGAHRLACSLCREEIHPVNHIRIQHCCDLEIGRAHPGDCCRSLTLPFSGAANGIQGNHGNRASRPPPQRVRRTLVPQTLFPLLLITLSYSEPHLLLSSSLCQIACLRPSSEISSDQGSESGNIRTLFP